MKRIMILLAAVVLIMGCLGTAYALLVAGGQPGVPDLNTLRQIYEARQNGQDMWVEDTIMPPTELKTWDDYVNWREDMLGRVSYYDPNVTLYTPVNNAELNKAAIGYLAKALGIVGGTGGITVINAVSTTPLYTEGSTNCLINLRTADGRIYQVSASRAIVPNATWGFSPVNFSVGDPGGLGGFYTENVTLYTPVTLESQDRKAVISYLAKTLGIVGGTGGIEVINAVDTTPGGMYGGTSLLINLRTADGRIYQVRAGHAIFPGATWTFTPVNFGPGPHMPFGGPFFNELRALSGEYAALVQGIEAEFDKQAKGIKTELDTLKAEKQEMIDAVKEAFQERKNGLETELSTLKTEQTEKLNGARTEFMDKLKAAIKEGRLGDIIGIIKEYLSKRVSIREQYNTKISELEKKLAGLNGEEQKAIGVIEAEYSAKITELEKKLAGFEGQKKTAIDALKKAAEEDIRALCEKYGVPFQKWFVDYVFRKYAPHIPEPPLPRGWVEWTEERMLPDGTRVYVLLRGPSVGDPWKSWVSPDGKKMYIPEGFSPGPDNMPADTNGDGIADGYYDFAGRFQPFVFRIKDCYGGGGCAAPLNPEFVEWIKNPPSPVIGYDKDGNPLYGGYVPPTVDLSHLNRIPANKDNAGGASGSISFVPHMGGTGQDEKLEYYQ